MAQRTEHEPRIGLRLTRERPKFEAEELARRRKTWVIRNWWLSHARYVRRAFA
ncbi:hypothetical protein [Novosphingobium album (ex Hu et al. 2023)]|uniref:hypothetical protein n=1 Tax=Novosphingobium album (ex Hu et al. 2023) TaxID=2930093 RepID=UPI001FBA7A04|nr:hypothetical protein [Novosphingobium album (ex Hu et al. 2023)]